MYKTISFKKKILTTAIASAAVAASFSGLSYAQDNTVEEVTVTGIRASLERAMDVKRNSSGVVDAISSEDIGKMPDSNLAESLQRITGVSVDRANGEGSRVTVRGFGPDFNLVTLNGRAMPSATFDSRSFDFGNLASEGVSGLEVYKTGKAHVASGGIGATINIKTAKPLDNPGFKATVGAKAVNDSTNRTGDDLTPEVSGLFSNTFADDTIGVTLTGSYQNRDSGTTGAYVNQWNVRVNDPDAGGTPLRTNAGATVINGPALGAADGKLDGGKYTIPSDLRYTLGDQERERTNGQLTLQYRPVEKVTATLDYTYSENEWHQQRIEQSLWFTDERAYLEFDDSAIKAPLYYGEILANPKDISFARQVQGAVSENEAVGFNLEFDVTDNFSLALDYMDASATVDPYDPRGHNLNASVAANVVKAQGVDWSRSLPSMEVLISDAATNNNLILDAADATTTRGNANYDWAQDDIEQLRLDGKWEISDQNKLAFGVESRTNDYLGRQRQNGDIIMGDWGGANPAKVPDAFFSSRNFLKDFDGYNTDGSITTGLDWDFEQVTSWAASQVGVLPNFSGFPDGEFKVTDAISTYRGIEEEIAAAYIQFDNSGEIAGLPYNLLVGLRYEETDVTASTNANLPQRIRWTGDDDFQTDLGQIVKFDRTATYDHMLPNLDFSTDLTDNVKGRFSYSETIARANYGLMKADTSVGDFKTYQASAGNPGLLPLESKNLDLSAEWYYDESSYVSLGYYRKDVDNFNSTAAIQGTLFDLRDPTKGPRQQKAVEDLRALGNTNPSLQQIYDQVLKNAGQTGPNGNIVPNEQDPLAIWSINQPVNNKSGVIDGFEFAIQHVFGETGFGLQANYTTVDGDVGFDNDLQGPNVSQFALVGLSDSANLVAFYDMNGLQARIAYNWRDSFLDTTNQYNNEPGYTEEYATTDANISYDINDNLTVSFEALNILGEDKRRHGRTDSQLWNLEVLGPRYSLGARYTF